MQGQILNLFNHRNSNLGDESIRVLHESRDGKIQIGTDGGVFIYDPRNETFKSYAKIPGNLNSLSSDQVFAIEEQDNGDFWFGTSFGLNKFNPATKRFIHFYKKDGLPSNMIVGLLFDYKGYLWISTDNGLAQMDVQQKVFKTYTISDGLQGNQFNAHSCYETRNNEILFGGTNGFNIFHPDSLKENTHIPPVVFTGFQIFNKPVKIGPDSPLKKHINIAKEINLTYKDYVFSLKFAALSYEAPERNQYAYKMEGFDEDWAYPGNSRTATYTNLSPGKYVFKVKASNNDGYWNQSGASIRINIKPPFWKTAWFRILVAILILSIAFTFHKLRMNNERSRSRLLEERVQERTKKLRALNEELESFAYSVSHDLRAPLRSITGFSKIIEEDFKSEIPEEAAGYLERINSAGKRMGLLIEDLLKLTRISRRELKKVPVNLSLMVREIVTNLETAEPHRIVEFKFQSGVMAFGDRQLIYILLENILRNAWKYTKNEKRAEIEFGRTIYKNQKVYFVSDNGAGFDMAYSDKLFQPFMRLHNEDEFEGTGVGLATVKRIIDRHDGQIWAESAENEGTTIYFNFGNS
ncbi:MAG: triple tyrosine motif-containing protein [Calditrichaceae bacterium]